MSPIYSEDVSVDAFHEVPKTGVIYVMGEAARHGYKPDDPNWTNFGQGQPDTGDLPFAPPRVESIQVAVADQEYSPVAGLWELREAVANYYNQMYRRGMASQYSAENVCISGGGRIGLTRIAASVGVTNLGHFLPDYTAYEELLGLFRRFMSIPKLLDPANAYDFAVEDLEQEILTRGLGALLMSNPCNPTGKLVGGEELRSWIQMARRVDCTLILDEFYSHYVWDRPVEESTAASYVEDVNKDPVIIVNGLTKSWRYPGWRVSWTVGPVDIIERIASAGSFLDGGASRPLQRAAIPLLDVEHSRAEIKAIQHTFRAKRELLLGRFKSMGIGIDRVPDGTFYVWADVSKLPEGINTGSSFFEACLENKVICVPGAFFDVNPGQRRQGRPSRFRNHIRFSFGPEVESLERGLDRIEKMIDSFRSAEAPAKAQAPSLL
ncbi:aspartate/methionine/tyrosine aminotransferase [Bradymonas sediminis]|nr:pyridoxal phosphate-dependent aminotransferase [Bradymonas sediminis]TDP76634.1 aspartate/methionine/tyrosine aminotransferase [Bradymonas sediminis]